MSRRLEDQWKILAATVLLAALIGGAGCSSDDEEGPVVLSAGTYSGIFATDIDTGSLSFTFAPPPINSTFGVTAGTGDVSATIESVNLGTVVVPGTWDAELNDLRLESIQGAVPFVQILGSFFGGSFVGITAGDLGSGAAAALPDDGGAATAYCGTFTRTGGAAGGRFNLIVGSGRAFAAGFDDLNFQSFAFGGTANGSSINLNDNDGTLASGTISGDSVSGTWSDDLGDGGGWSGSTGNCSGS